MDVAALVTHELERAGGHCHGLGADAEETADIDDDLAAEPCAMDMRNRADLLVIGAIDDGALEYGRSEFGATEANVRGVIHLGSPLGWGVLG